MGRRPDLIHVAGRPAVRATVCVHGYPSPRPDQYGAMAGPQKLEETMTANPRCQVYIRLQLKLNRALVCVVRDWLTAWPARGDARNELAMVVGYVMKY
jgi:hypothetical protein